MRTRGPRSLMALLLTATAGAFGVAALSAGPAHAAADATCGGPLQPLCVPTAKVSVQTSETDGTIVVTWTPGAGNTTSVNVDQPSLQWVQQTNAPTGAPFPTLSPLRLSGACTGSSVVTCTYQWPPEMLFAGYVLNGTYSFSATADNCLAATLVCSKPATVTQPVPVANQPLAPTLVKADVVPNSPSVTVSWAPNHEPDVVGYEVFRSDQSFACEALTKSDKPPPSSYSCLDLPPKDGSYAYHVIAYRWGATYDTATENQVASVASATTKSVSVTGTSANTSTTVAGSGPGTLGPPGFNVKPGTGKPATGTFPGAFKPTPGTAASVAGSDAPGNGDTGFAPTLPYGQQPSTTVSEDPGSLAAPVVPAHKGKTSVGTIAVVGAGLLIGVIALHGLWLRSEVRRSGTLEVLEPEA
jgi:hypothetical protein